MHKDRFDLENEINEILSFSQLLDNLASAVSEDELSQDEIINALIGLAVLLKINHIKLYNTLCSCFNLNSNADLDANKG